MVDIDVNQEVTVTDKTVKVYGDVLRYFNSKKPHKRETEKREAESNMNKFWQGIYAMLKETDNYGIAMVCFPFVLVLSGILVQFDFFNERKAGKVPGLLSGLTELSL